MSILIKKPGILTTVQDLGRTGYRRLGINPGGVMDRTATRLINILLGNDDDDAVLEMHFPAAEIEFESPCTFALGGADLSPDLSGNKIENWCVCTAEAGDTLRFTSKILGNRAYLAVAGGFAVEKWLGSASTNLNVGIGGHEGRKLLAGDRIELQESHDPSRPAMRRIAPSLIPYYSVFPTVRITTGAEFDNFDEVGKSVLESQNFTISNNSNRMGFRLSGKPLVLATPFEFISSAVSFGTVQLLPDGQLIVLMADHQTSGGYPRLAHVAERDLPVIAQLGSGDKVAFHLISHSHAEALNAEHERDIALFRVGCMLRR